MSGQSLKKQSKSINDRLARPMRSLRISITNRCNFNCFYCKPASKSAAGECGIPSQLSYGEIVKLTRIFRDLGVNNVRLTGGEPLIRPDVNKLIQSLKGIPGINEVTLTTNGFHLESQLQQLIDAGLDRINMSLDSFQPERFYRLTGKKNLNKVLRGLKKLLNEPAVHPIKINTVVIRGFNDDEVLDFADWAASSGQTVRFIEFMPLEKGLTWKKSELLLSSEIKEIISQKYSLIPLNNYRHDTAEKFQLKNSGGKIGFISSISHPFCNSCDRIRLTADGRVKACLFSYDETDLTPSIRPVFKPEQLKELIKTNFQTRWEGGCEKLQQGSYDFQRQSRTMSDIGG